MVVIHKIMMSVNISKHVHDTLENLPYQKVLMSTEELTIYMST